MPKNVNVSTDLGIATTTSNQPDRALAQFDHSLAIDPKHSKTLLNVGIVRAFGKQDLDGRREAWQKVIAWPPTARKPRSPNAAWTVCAPAHAGDRAAATPRPTGVGPWGG